METINFWNLHLYVRTVNYEIIGVWPWTQTEILETFLGHFGQCARYREHLSSPATRISSHRFASLTHCGKIQLSLQKIKFLKSFDFWRKNSNSILEKIHLKIDFFWQTFGFCHSVSSFVCGDNAHPASSVFAPFFSKIQTFRIWAVFRVMQCTQKQDQKETRAIIQNISHIS